MGKDFNPQEIVKIAIEVENNGEKLYEALENKAADQKVRAVWKYLKEQETAHSKTFKDMLDKTGEYIVQEFNPGEYQAYLRAIADEYIITSDLAKKKASQGFKTDLEAIEFAIHIEKESIITYMALKDYVILSKHPVLDRIIAEEKNHLADLVELKNAIKA
ncbi:MAG: ferritin family protein [Candidatus Omnitrophica bacterium]|nr:ferritin family protein [Candidatus Omnitrophota bacterium]